MRTPEDRWPHPVPTHEQRLLINDIANRQYRARAEGDVNTFYHCALALEDLSHYE